MATPPRALDVRAPFTIYRVIGRRPSPVYLDGDRRPSARPGTGGRLWEPVFDRLDLHPGDQIQEQSSGFVLVREETRPVPIRLDTPVARTLDNALTQAADSYAADCRRADALVAEGLLNEAAKRRKPVDGTVAASRDLPQDHPLVLRRD